MSPLKTPVDVNDHVRGNAEALCVVVEYGDYQCPDCRKAHGVVHRIEQHFGEPLGFVFRNFPLTRIHPFAQSAAEVAEFADTAGKFWPMHDQLFAHQPRLGEALYEELAAKLGLDADALRAAREGDVLTKLVRDDFSSGVRSGVNGTPTFFINGERHNGPADFNSLAEKIEAALAETAPK